MNQLIGTSHLLFWHFIVIAGLIGGAIVPGAIATFCFNLIASSLQKTYDDHKNSNNIGHILDCMLYRISKGFVHLSVKTGQWLGSIALALLIVGVVGRLIIFSSLHWREIWGP